MQRIKKTKLSPLPDKNRKNAVYDWLSIREDYINGTEQEDGIVVYPTPTELSEKYGVPYQSLLNKSHKERWNDHRAARTREKNIAIHQERVKKLAKKAVIFDETTVDAAQVAQKLVLDRLMELESIRERDKARIQRVLAEWDVTEDSDVDMEALRKELRPMIWSTEIFELAKSLSLFAESGRRALGIKEDETALTMNQQINIQMVSQNAQDELDSDDENRARAILQIIRNPNLVIPNLVEPETVPELENIVEAEVLEIEA